MQKAETSKVESNKLKEKAYVSKELLLGAKKNKFYDKIPSLRKKYEHEMKKSAEKALRARELKVKVNATIKDFYLKNDKEHRKAMERYNLAKKNYSEALKSKVQDTINKTLPVFKKTKENLSKKKTKVQDSKILVKKIKEQVGNQSILKKDIKNIEKSGKKIASKDLAKRIEDFGSSGKN